LFCIILFSFFLFYLLFLSNDKAFVRLSIAFLIFFIIFIKNLFYGETKLLNNRLSNIKNNKLLNSRLLNIEDMTLKFFFFNGTLKGRDKVFF